MGLFPSSFENEYILLVMDHVFEWVKVIPTRTNDDKMVVKFLMENIIAIWHTRAIINNQDTHFTKGLLMVY